MKNFMPSPFPERDARALAQAVTKSLQRLDLSPGQWELVESWMDRVFVDRLTKVEFAVSDYIK